MSTINYTYNVIVDRFRQFSDGHFQLRRFTHGEISQADLEKEAEWPWMHVKPRAINYSPGTRAFSFEIFISDLPRDKEDKTGYQAESITDCSLIFQDLINEIHLGNMFGDDVVLTRPVNSEPFVEQYTHTLTGVTGIIELSLDYDWSACSIPASWNYNTPTDSPSDGWGALQFIESLHQDGVFVSLDNDQEAPGNSYYYGTNASGVKGWYAIVDNIGLTCETLPDCAVIISIVDDIAALQAAAITNTSELVNDGEDGINPFITAQDLPSLTGYVPYTGATGAVNLGAFDLTVNELTVGKGASGLANNTALGHQALFHTTTGNYNTAAGHEAGHNLTTGNYNTALGQSAMFTATTASQNTAVGLNALLNTTSGGSNTSVGLDSLQHNSTGSSNTAVGYNAGSHITDGTTPNTTASNSVFIGRDTKAKVNGGANEIVIGQGAIGNGTNTATIGNSSVTANYFNGSVNGGSFVKSGGTSSQFLKADGSVDSSAYYVLPSLTSGSVLFSNGTTIAQNNANFFWDNTNIGLALGGTTLNANYILQVNGSKGVRISGNGAGFGYNLLRGSESSTFASNGSAGVFDSTTTLTFNTAGNERMRINSTGNVGIGTASPAGKFTVSDGTRSGGFNPNTALNSFVVFTSTNHPLVFATNNNENARIATTGNVLIGTTTDAGYKLDVNGTARIQSALTASANINVDSGASNSAILFKTAGTNKGVIGTDNSIFGVNNSIIGLYVYGANDFELSTNNIRRLIAKGNGNILIGTTTDVASSRLTVESTTQGFLPPRMTTTQKNAIATPATGLMVYDTTLNLISVYNGTIWISL